MTSQEQVRVTQADREAYLDIFGIRGGSDAHSILAGEWDDLTGMQIIARHRQAAEAEAKAREAELVKALWLFREFVLHNATQWQTGANHHHPIYPMIAELIGEMGGIVSGEHRRFIQPENRAALTRTGAA